MGLLGMQGDDGRRRGCGNKVWECQNFASYHKGLRTETVPLRILGYKELLAMYPSEHIIIPRPCVCVVASLTSASLVPALTLLPGCPFLSKPITVSARYDLAHLHSPGLTFSIACSMVICFPPDPFILASGFCFQRDSLLAELAGQLWASCRSRLQGDQMPLSLSQSPYLEPWQ